MKGRRININYSAEELAWIKARRRDPRRALHAAFCETFRRNDVPLDNFKNLCKRKGWLTGRTGHYPKGHEPANKGQKMPFNANSARTQFKKGNSPHNTKYLGHEHVRTDGYVEILIDEPNPHTGFKWRYVHKHRLLWQQANGPIPEGCVLKCLDGDKTNTDPSNWEAIPRAMLPRLNGRFGRNYDGAAPEIKPAILAVAKLEHKMHTLKTRKKETAA